MDSDVFRLQMERMKTHFGQSKYSSEICKLILRAVNQMSDEWMVRTVDLFIYECERPPLGPKFREEVAKERERIYQIEKHRYSEEAKTAMSSIYSSDDIKMICKSIIDRARGKLKDNDWDCQLKLLNSAPTSIEQERRWRKGSES